MDLFMCPYCGQTVSTAGCAPGSTVACPHCRGHFMLGSPQPAFAVVTPVVVAPQPMTHAGPPPRTPATPAKRGFFDTLKRGFSQLVDPSREENLAEQARELYNRVAIEGKRFTLEIAAAHLGIDPADLLVVSERAFAKVTEKLWADNELTPAEQQLMGWAEQALRVPPQRANELKWQAGIAAFERALAQVFDDGRVEPHEGEQLRRIATALGTPLPDLSQRYFRQKGEGLLRGMFLAAVEDGVLLPSEWQSLVDATERIGLTREHLLTAIAGPGQTFVEHILADAKADNRVSHDELETLNWLLENLSLAGKFRSYVRSEIHELQIFTDIEEGRLPSLPNARDIQIKSGEIVHLCEPATYAKVKQTRHGAQLDSTSGLVAITDHRFIFSSFERSLTITLSKVVGCVLGRHGVEVRSAGKGGGFYDFAKQNRLAHAILLTAVGRANQTILERFTGPPSRHITREVRQRVWQRYGGRCAECEADDYLEYDHVIPVARGGANTENNVQLLCRRCNLAKSDKI